METFILDKRLKTNVDYFTEADTALIIRFFGTSDTARVTAKVEGVPCGEFITDIANLMTDETNRHPLHDLGDLYIVVPPDKTYRFEGTTGQYVRVKGQILRFAPGEVLPAAHAARYTEQGKKYWDFVADALTSTVTVAAGSATDLISFTCPTGEKWVFNGLLMAEAVKNVTKEYDMTIRLTLQDKPLDNLINEKTPLGLTQYATPYPADDTDGAIPTYLKEKPIEVKPGEILKVQAYNTSTTAIDLSATVSKALIQGVKEYL